MNEGFEGRYFNLLKEDTIKNINSILTRLNEAEMSDEDKRDSQLLRDILAKARSASWDKRRSLSYTPEERAVADKYNLTLPTKVKNFDGTKITRISDKDVDYEKGHGRNREIANLGSELDSHPQSKVVMRRDANLADFIRKRKERGPAKDRPYREADKYATADDVNAFGDTTFMHDKSGRFGYDSWDKKYGRGPSLARGKDRNADLSDVEKDRIRVNKEMSQPVKDMKAALKDRKSNQEYLDNVDLRYARDVAYARDRFDRDMKDAKETRKRDSEQSRAGIDDANSKINKLLKKESFDCSDDDDEYFSHVSFGEPYAPQTEDDYEVFESFRRSLREKILSLREAEMPDEDKRDTEILKDIYRKTQVRANAALTPEEKAVLKKYGLERTPWDKNIHVGRDVGARRIQGSPLFQRGDFDKKWNRNGFRYDDPKADKINYADRARKRPARDAQEDDLRSRDYWDMPTPDYAARHERDSDDEWNPLTNHTYQKRERHSENQKMTQNVRDMKRALRDRKASQSKVDSADADLQAQLDKLRREYEDRIAGVKRGHESRTEYSKKDVQRNQDAIDRLLRRKEEK